MEIRVLGPIEVHANDSAVSVGGPRQRRIVAALAMQPNEVVSVDRLADITWAGEELPQHSERNVRTYVHRIRTAVGEDLAPRFATAAPGYLLNVEAGELDATRFEAECARGGRLHDRGDSQGAVAALDEALEMWRGVPYAEFADEEWSRTEVSRLIEVRAAALEVRCEALLHQGRGSEALPTLDALVSEHPLRERPRALQMQALYQGGRHAEALRAFQDFREYVIEEAGVDPTDDLVALDRSIAAGTLELSTDSGSVRGYEVHELIGTGAFADVHRGTQPSLGREVAIKSVKAELANRPEFIRGFEAEAAIIARLEHPYIVPLYDFWREPDRAYLVMRWLTGGSLETRLDAGPLALEHAAQMVEQVGSALAVAHRAGVVHRDVKSANILLDDDGNSFLTDFGIAVEAAGPENPAAALSEGSPAYASPEQLRREQVGPAADVFGLAIAAFEALTGELPFADAVDRAALLRRQLHDPIPAPSAVRPGLPAGVDEVLATATAKDPRQRYQDMNEFVAAFVAAIADTRAATPALQQVASRLTHTLGAVENPYRGLRAFDEADADAFFGRDRLVDELLGHLEGSEDRDGRFLAVVGPSGSGKSSVVGAGVVPSLRSSALPGSGDWFITTMTPGSHPFEALETALLRIAVNPPASLLEQLEHDRRGIVRGTRRILPTDEATAVLVIDQFEELFTQCESEEVRTQFLEGLTVAAKDPSSPLRLVITLRADFYDQPLRDEGFAGLLKSHAVTVTPLAADELEQAIVRPAESVGAMLEPGLVAEVVADVSSQPGALPLMQYALTELFEARVSGMMMVSAYRDLGGLSGALARRAEDLQSGLDSEGQLAARRVFSRLVTLGEGSEDTRRRVTRSELGSEPSTNAVVDTYGRARLLSFDRDSATREPTVEVAHEALIREWPRLREWLDEDRDGLRVQRSITSTAGLWLSSGRDDGDLFRGGRLEAAAEYESEHGDELNADERQFVDQSRRMSEREAARKKRRGRILAGALAASGVLLVVALIAGLVAVQQRNDARDTRFDSDVRRIVAQASNQAGTDRSLGLLLASLAYDLQPSVETLGGLQSVLISLPSGWLFSFNGPEAYLAVRVSSDDGFIAARHENGVDLFGAGDGLPAGTVVGPPGVAVDTSSGAVAMGGSNGAWQIAALPDGQLIIEGTADAGVTTVAFNHSGSSLAVGTSSGQVSIVDLANGAASSADIQLNGADGQPTPVTHLAWSASDGRLIAGGGAFAAAIVVDSATGDVVGPPLSFESFNTGATSVGFDGEAAVIVNGPAVRFDEASFEPTIVDTEGELINL
ncbi:MAG: protein kinase domain-containing protein, partial [Acidimicrobiales bacterium]